MEEKISNNEKRILIVIFVTILGMIIEIAFGYLTQSMSLLAEGYHMSVHVLTLVLAYISYILARKFKNSDKFINGTSKIGVLAGYTSAVFLLLTAFGIIYESVERFFSPEQILFNEAILVSVFALVINLACIIFMEGKLHLHCSHSHQGADYNYKAAYYHILSDVLISVLTIFALLAGKIWNFTHLDALTGIAGAVLILIWAGKLLKHTVKILIDMKI